MVGHTTVAVLHDTLRLTPTQFLVLGGIAGAGLGFWMGWSEGSKRYLANGTKQMKEIGRGGGDRKLNPLSQVLSCQRRSTAALFPIGVKWCQISANCS